MFHLFSSLLQSFPQGPAHAGAFWREIFDAYSGRRRYYHNLGHLEYMYAQLAGHQNDIKDWSALLFSLFYHDVVYNPLKKDNEARSADLAAKRMKTVGASEEMIARTREQILATRTHEAPAGDTDTCFLLDADLSILGSDPAEYDNYSRQIRREYAVFPDLLYRPGRRKVLEHFLSMERIFKTDAFFHRLEAQARRNLEWEMNC